MLSTWKQWLIKVAAKKVASALGGYAAGKAVFFITQIPVVVAQLHEAGITIDVAKFEPYIVGVVTAGVILAVDFVNLHLTKTKEA